MPIFNQNLITFGQITSGDTQSAAISRRALLFLKENSKLFLGSAAKCLPRQLPSAYFFSSSTELQQGNEPLAHFYKALKGFVGEGEFKEASFFFRPH